MRTENDNRDCPNGLVGSSHRDCEVRCIPWDCGQKLIGVFNPSRPHRVTLRRLAKPSRSPQLLFVEDNICICIPILCRPASFPGSPLSRLPWKPPCLGPLGPGVRAWVQNSLQVAHCASISILRRSDMQTYKTAVYIHVL